MLTLAKLQQYYTVDARGCWIWNRTMYPTGYGRFNGKPAHRVSYHLHFGEIPAGLNVCHKCDVKACVNPAHLFLGTQHENLMDMARKGRHGRSQLTAETARRIKGLLRSIRPGTSDYFVSNLLGELFGVSRGAIEGIRDQTTWTHV